MINLDEARKRWMTDRPIYKRLAEYVRKQIKSALSSRGIDCQDKARAKEPDSLLKKLLRKKELSYDKINDRAGVRIIVPREDVAEKVDKVVRQMFNVIKREDKKEGLRYNELGYLGIHYDVELRNTKQHQEFSERVCEIQIQTHAQNLWAETSHGLSYKPTQESTDEIKRPVFRLMALVEIFDQEIMRTWKTIRSQPGFPEAKMLEHLEKYYFTLTAKDFDRHLSLDIIKNLKGLYSKKEIQTFPNVMQIFMDKHRKKLETILQRYANTTRRNPLLYQPECIMIYERMNANQFTLKEEWGHHYPIPLLENLAVVWGCRL